MLSWMTAYEFEKDKLIFEYYAHSNVGVRITIFDYDPRWKCKKRVFSDFFQLV